MTTTPTLLGLQFALGYPQSVSVYDDYLQARQVVDLLHDQQFPVQNIALVGTDHKLVERVTGRLTRAKAAAGELSRLWIGMLVVIAIFLLSNRGQLGLLIIAPLLGAVFKLVWGQIGFTPATRDVNPARHVVATKYEVLTEHRFVQQTRELLATRPAAHS